MSLPRRIEGKKRTYAGKLEARTHIRISQRVCTQVSVREKNLQGGSDVDMRVETLELKQREKRTDLCVHACTHQDSFWVI